MAMIDMTLDKQEAQEALGDSISPTSDLPRYPYGLELCLDDESLEKLGITTPPAVGTKVQITAIATVTGVRSYQIQTETEPGEKPENSETSVDLQITAMELSSPTQQSSAASLYGGA